MPVISGIYVKDFPAYGGVISNDTILVVAETGNPIAYRTTLAALLTSQGIGKTTLATTSGVTITITWQTDIVPGDTRTYAQKHGNAIGAITGTYDDSGVQRPYNPDWSYTLTGANINILTLTTLFTGKLTII